MNAIQEIPPEEKTARANNDEASEESAKEEPVDEYTARMDRMVEGLKKRSKTEHNKQFKTTLIWIGVGAAIIVVSIYLVLNSTFSGTSLEFLAR